MAKLQRRAFGDADDVREFADGRLERYDMGDFRVGRSILQPGWRWSKTIKPIARTDLCEFHHIGLCIGGACRIRTKEGAEIEISAGQFYEVPAGHDAWVVGDEPYVTIDWNPSSAFAQWEGGGFDRIVATLLMTDIVDSTAQARELGVGRWRDLLSAHNMLVRRVLESFRGREVKMTGDGFLATFDGAERAIRAAQEITRSVPELGMQVRTGVHTGELELEGDDVRGLTVHVVERIMGQAGPGQVAVSWATRELLAGSAVEFTDLGLQQIKGLTDERHVYLVEPVA